MDIKDYAQMMSYLTRPRDVVPDPSTINQEPRIGYSGAGVVLDIGTAGIKKAIPFVKQKLNEIIPYGGSTKGIGTSTPKADVTPERNFINAFSELQNNYFGGNFTKTSEALGQSREKIKGIFDRLRQ